MPATVNHVLTATTPDDPLYEIRPTHWNSSHALTLDAAGSEIVGAFSNANGMSFGLSAGQVTGSYTVPSVAAFLTTAALSNHSHGDPTLFLTNISGTTASASNGFTLSLSAGAGGAGDGGNILAAGTRTAGSNSSVLFSNANGVTFGLNAVNGSVMTASYTVPTLTEFVFSNSNGVSFGTNGSTVTATVATNYQSQGAYLTTAALSNHSHGNPQLNLTNLSGTTASNSAGFTLSLSAAAPGGGAAVNFSAGTTSGNLQSVTFADGGGVSFGLNAGTITATVATNYLTSQSNQAFSAPGGSSAFQTLVFANSQGVSWSNSNGSVVATVKTDYLTQQSTQPVAVSGSNGSFTYATATFGSSNGIHFYTTNGSLVASHNGLTSQSNQALSGSNGSFTFQTATFGALNGLTFYTSNGSMVGSHNGLTTARASNDAIGLNTAGSNMTWTANSSGLSIDARGYAGTGTSATNASVTLNSNGLQISVAAPGGGGSINFSAGSTSSNIASVTFGNAGGVTFGLGTGASAGLITASAPAAAAANATHSIVGVTAFDASTASFANGNMNFLVAGNMIGGFSTGTPNSLVLYAIPPPVESVFWRPNENLTTIGAPINASASVVYVPMDMGVSASRFDMIASVNVATAANNSSAGLLYSLTAVAYTLNGATLSSLSSITTQNQMTWTSNATGSVTGGFFLSAPLAFNATGADKYWFGVQLSTRATGLTGAATTSLGNTVSMMGVATAIMGAFSAREPGAGTASGNGWFYGLGMYSGTTNFSTIGLSNLTQQGTNAARADVAIRLLNV